MRPLSSDSVDYSVLFPRPSHAAEHGGRIEQTVEGDFGFATSRAWYLPSIAIAVINGELRSNLHIRQHEERECTVINSIYTIKGGLASSFGGVHKKLSLAEGFHQFVYRSDVMDEHLVSASGREFAILRIAIDCPRFLGLLSLDEKWCDDLRFRIRSKEPIVGTGQSLKISSVMYRTISDIINCPLSGSLGTIFLEGKVLELLAYQLHQYHSIDLAQHMPMSRSDREIFFEIKAYLTDTFEKEHSLRSLSRQFGINECKLKKGFRELFGTTVFGYIHAMKMQQARTLMEEAGYTVSEVASRTGYKNPNHFSAAFKKQFGLSPSVIRKAQIVS